MLLCYRLSAHLLSQEVYFLITLLLAELEPSIKKYSAELTLGEMEVILLVQFVTVSYVCVFVCMYVLLYLFPKVLIPYFILVS